MKFVIDNRNLRIEKIFTKMKIGHYECVQK